MDIKKLTKEQAVIISGFTGILCGEFADFHADVEKRLGRGVQTFEFGFKEFMAEVKKLYEADFIEMGTVDKEQAKAQAVPEWISVQDRMPEQGQKVLVFRPDAHNHPHKDPNFKICTYAGADIFINSHFEHVITHWKPLESPIEAQEQKG